MPCVRHIIVCEGESEWAYLQRLQSFLESEPLADGAFEPPLRFIVPQRVIVKGGSFGQMKSRYNQTRRENRNASIQVWTDFDLYHRNDNRCAEHYAAKTAGIPDFRFSFHNFEDFFALHWDGAPLADWLHFGSPAGCGHFTAPLHASGYLPEIERIFPGYGKGQLSPDFISWASLKNLKSNLAHQPLSNPHNLANIRSFATFLVDQIDRAYPRALDPDPPAMAPVPADSSQSSQPQPASNDASVPRNPHDTTSGSNTTSQPPL
jgi:hypothetical protein